MLDLTGSLQILILEGNSLSICEFPLSDDNCMKMSEEEWNIVSLDGVEVFN
jgi:hypothetical protein